MRPLLSTSAAQPLRGIGELNPVRDFVLVPGAMAKLCEFRMRDIGDQLIDRLDRRDLEVEFTIPPGRTGIEILSMIERANPRDNNSERKGVVVPEGILLDDQRFLYEPAGAQGCRFCFVIFGNFLQADEGAALEVQIQASRDQFEIVPQPIALLAAALCRDREGFPEENRIGTCEDPGGICPGITLVTGYQEKWRVGMKGVPKQGLQGMCSGRYGLAAVAFHMLAGDKRPITWAAVKKAA
jgi:hypothetical protein